MAPAPANPSAPESPRGKAAGFLTAFVVTLAVVEGLVLAIVALPRWLSAPSPAQLRALHPGMPQEEVLTLLGKPRRQSDTAWQYPLRIGFGENRNFLSRDTFQVIFDQKREVRFAYCGD